MPTDSIQLQIVKNGGAPATGAITAALSDTILLKLASPSGVRSVKYRIYEFPDGFPLPSGWTQEAANRYAVVVANGGNAPLITLPASNEDLKGKYFFDAVANDQKYNGAISAALRSKAQLEIPFASGIEDVGFGETNEFDLLRQGVRAIKKAIRFFNTAIITGGGVTDHGALSGLSDDDHPQYLRADGTRKLSGNWDVDGKKITNHATPTSPGDVANKAYVDANSGGDFVTDHGLLTGLNDDDHAALYELWARPVVAYTGAASAPALADARKHITTSHGSANTFTLPSNASIAFAVGTLLVGTNIGAGAMTLTQGSGATMNGSGTVAQNGWWWAKKTATNTWQVFVGGSSVLADASVTQAKLAPGVVAPIPCCWTTVTTNVASLTGTGVTGDSVALNTPGQLAFLIGQTDKKQNGPWVVGTPWTRPSWFTTGQNVAGFRLNVERGTDYHDTDWVCTTNSTAIVGTDDLDWDAPRFRDYLYNTEIVSSGATPAVDWSKGGPQKTTLAANATPTFTPPPTGVGWLQWHVVQDSTPRTITFPGSVVGTPPQPSSVSGSHTFYQFFWDGTSYHFTGAAVTVSGTTLSLVGSSIKLRDAVANGQQWLWLDSAWYLLGPESGSALGDASVTLQFATANQYHWPPGTNTTANRTLTLGTTGLAAGPNAGVGAELSIMFLRSSYANNIAVANGGVGGGTLFTLNSGGSKPLVVTFYFDGTDWKIAGWRYLGTVTAA